MVIRSKSKKPMSRGMEILFTSKEIRMKIWPIGNT